MPHEPPGSRYVMPDPAVFPSGQEVVGVGADLAPGTLLAGYRSGLFAMPHGRRLLWYSPDPRGVLPLHRFHASRSLRRSVRSFELSVDAAFDDVVTACANPDRPGGRWITRRYQDAYRHLHRDGWAHSVEVWRSGSLVGGVFGVEVGGLFCGESIFHRSTDASKAALWALVGLLSADGATARMFDVQWLTDHLASLGAVSIPRAAYLAALPPALALPPLLGPRSRIPVLDVAIV